MRASRAYFMLALSLIVLGAAGLIVTAGWSPSPATAGPSSDSGWLGVMLRDLDGGTRAEFGIDRRVEGALVTRVLPDSPAESAGILEGDVIVEIDNRRVASMTEAVEAARGLTPGDKVLVVVNRNGTSRGLTVNPGESGDRHLSFYDDGRHAPGVDKEVLKHFKVPHALKAPRAPKAPRVWKAPRAPRAPRVWGEDGRKVIVFHGDDGEEHRIHIGGDDDGKHSWSWTSDDEDDDGEHRIVIRRGDDDDEAEVWIYRGDDDDGHRIVIDGDDDDDQGVIIIGGDDDGKRSWSWTSDDEDDDGEHRIVIRRGDDDEDDGEARVWIHRDGDKRPLKLHKDGDRRVKVRSRGHAGFLGVETRKLGGQLSRYFDVDEDQGVLVSEVVKDSPAEKAGLAAGDVIVAVDGDEVEDSDDLRRLIRAHEPGETINLDVVRRGAQKRVEVQLGDVSDFSDADWSGLHELLADKFRFDGDGPVRVMDLEIPDLDELEALEGLDGLEALEVLEGLNLNIEIPDIHFPEMDFEIHGLDPEERQELREELEEQRIKLREHGIKIREHLDDEDGHIRIRIEEGMLKLQEHLDELREQLQDVYRDSGKVRSERRRALEEVRRELKQTQQHREQALEEVRRELKQTQQYREQALEEALRLKQEALRETDEYLREARELMRRKEAEKREAKRVQEDV